MRSEQPLLTFRTNQRWFAATTASLIVVVFGFVTVRALVVDHPRPANDWVLLAIYLAVTAALVVAVRPNLRPVVLTRAEITAPKALHDLHVPVTEVAGVGMSLISAGRASGWRTTVWLIDGRRVQLARYLGGRRNRPDRGGQDSTRLLWERIVELQGPGGVLVGEARQRFETARWRAARVIWCPDDDTMYDPQAWEKQDPRAQPRGSCE
jgi:hypothetical protein